MAQFIGAVVFVVGAEDLIEHLEQVLIILMDAGQGSVIGFKAVF
mgnify:CR=1 FL=1